jgi:DNA primase
MNGEAKEEVRSRLDIESVIGEYVQLKRAGRNWKGLSPFSDEKTASFFVSPEKGIWHDFSSNQGGDLFSFIMQVEGMEFREALEHLARKGGVDLSHYEQKTGSSRDLGAKKMRLLAMHESATTFYQRHLINTETAVAYVKKRGLNKQVVHDFRLGYAPADGSVLQRFLSEKGYTEHEMRNGGLIGSRGSDLFRERLMVPLMDPQGQVIGFTARLMRDIENAPKYLNTPQTVLYDKGRHVFGLYQAKDAIRKNDRSVVVEGNLDVISSHQVGVTNVVATAGTAMTDSHLKILSRFSDHVLLAFDGDKAGIAATERAIPIAQAVGVELRIISLPGAAKDPDELIQKDVELWKQAIDTSHPAIEWVIDHYLADHDPATALGKRAVTTEALTLLSSVDDLVEQEHYLKMLSGKTQTSLETLRVRMMQLQDALQQRYKPVKQTVSTIIDDDPKQDALLALLVSDKELRDTAMGLSVDAFNGVQRQSLFRYLITHPEGIVNDVIPRELQDFETYVKIVQLKVETRYAEHTAQERLDEASHLVTQIKQQHIKQMKAVLTAALRDAEAAGDESEGSRIMNELNELIKEDHQRAKKIRNS